MSDVPIDKGDPECLDCARHLDRLWFERWRRRLSKGTLRRWLWDNLFLEIGAPTEFTGPRGELAASLMPKGADGEPDEKRTAEVLAQAWAVYDASEERVDSAERRATTLQGAITIAVTLLLTGGAFLADPAKVQGDGWRLALALSLFAVIVCFLFAGLRALATTSTIHVFHRPTPEEIPARTALPLAQARIETATEVLRNYACNTRVADWKVAYLGAAAWWFRLGLASLLVLGTLLAAYVTFGPSTPPAPKSCVGVHIDLLPLPGASQQGGLSIQDCMAR